MFRLVDHRERDKGPKVRIARLTYSDSFPISEATSSETELLFDHSECVLDLGANVGFGAGLRSDSLGVGKQLIGFK